MCLTWPYLQAASYTIIPTRHTDFIIVLLVQWKANFELIGHGRKDNKQRPRKGKKKKSVKKLTLELGESNHLNFFNFLKFEQVYERIKPILALIF